MVEEPEQAVVVPKQQLIYGVGFKQLVVLSLIKDISSTRLIIMSFSYFDIISSFACSELCMLCVCTCICVCMCVCACVCVCVFFQRIKMIAYRSNKR